MHIPLFAIPACLSGWLIWRRLFRTHLNLFLRLFLTAAFSVVISMVLYWVGILVSIYLFQANDPVTW